MTVQIKGTDGVCRLCRLDSELRLSHIIPKFMFRPMSRLAQETPMRFGPQVHLDQLGHLKEFMLCEACEHKFSNYERAASEFLCRLNETQAETATRPICRKSLDYDRLKLFFLSLLWRCAVCTNGIARRVDLGPRLGSLTTLVMGGDPGAENEFPIMLRLVAESKEARNAVLTVPESMRRDGRNGYEMYGNGVEISWIVDKRGAAQEAVPFTLHSDGTWLIEMIRGADCPVWSRAVANAHEQDRMRRRAGGRRR